ADDDNPSTASGVVLVEGTAREQWDLHHLEISRRDDMVKGRWQAPRWLAWNRDAPQGRHTVHGKKPNGRGIAHTRQFDQLCDKAPEEVGSLLSGNIPGIGQRYIRR